MCANEKPAVTESESQGVKFVRQGFCHRKWKQTDTMVGGTKGWFSHIQARRVSKIRQPVASQLEPPLEGRTEARKEAGRQITRSYSDGATITVRWEGYHREVGNPSPSIQGQCLCMSCARLQAAIPGVWKCVTFVIFPPAPPKEDMKEEPLEMRPPRWKRHQGRGWVRVRKDFLSHTAPSRSG